MLSNVPLQQAIMYDPALGVDRGIDLYLDCLSSSPFHLSILTEVASIPHINTIVLHFEGVIFLF